MVADINKLLKPTGFSLSLIESLNGLADTFWSEPKIRV